MLLAASQQFGTNQIDLCYFDGDGSLIISSLQVFENYHIWSPSILKYPSIASPLAPIAISQQFGASQTDIFYIDTNGQLNVIFNKGNNVWISGVPIGSRIGFPGSGPMNLAVSQQFGADQTDVFAIDNTAQLNVFWIKNQKNWQQTQIGPQYSSPPGSPLAVSRQANYNQTDVFFADYAGFVNGHLEQ
jgi:hypothetical protein